MGEFIFNDKMLAQCLKKSVSFISIPFCLSLLYFDFDRHQLHSKENDSFDCETLVEIITNLFSLGLLVNYEIFIFSE